jgi:hypothetical protein
MYCTKDPGRIRIFWASRIRVRIGLSEERIRGYGSASGSLPMARIRNTAFNQPNRFLLYCETPKKFKRLIYSPNQTWWDGHLVVVLESELEDAGIVLPEVRRDMQGDA